MVTPEQWQTCERFGHQEFDLVMPVRNMLLHRGIPRRGPTSILLHILGISPGFLLPVFDNGARPTPR